jgi:hypothetical protein
MERVGLGLGTVPVGFAILVLWELGFFGGLGILEELGVATLEIGWGDDYDGLVLSYSLFPPHLRFFEIDTQ